MKFRCIFLTSVYNELANVKSVQYALLPSPALQTVMPAFIIFCAHLICRRCGSYWWSTDDKRLKKARQQSVLPILIHHQLLLFDAPLNPLSAPTHQLQKTATMFNPAGTCRKQNRMGAGIQMEVLRRPGGFGFTEVICSLYNLSWFSLALLCSLQISPSYPLPVSCVRVGQLCSVFQLCQHFEGSVR